MTNEQLAILLLCLHERIGREISALELVLIEHGMDQYTERRHTASQDSPCHRTTYLPGLLTSCRNEDHYADVPNGSVVCLDDLKTVVDDLGAHISMLRPQEERADV